MYDVKNGNLCIVNFLGYKKGKLRYKMRLNLGAVLGMEGRFMSIHKLNDSKDKKGTFIEEIQHQEKQQHHLKNQYQ